jgi:hypothetical protein
MSIKGKAREYLEAFANYEAEKNVQDRSEAEARSASEEMEDADLIEHQKLEALVGEIADKDQWQQITEKIDSGDSEVERRLDAFLDKCRVEIDYLTHVRAAGNAEIKTSVEDVIAGVKNAVRSDLPQLLTEDFDE